LFLASQLVPRQLKNIAKTKSKIVRNEDEKAPERGSSGAFSCLLLGAAQK
jgi:hypothetical protein